MVIALYFVGLFIRIVCTPFSNVTTSSLYLLPASAAGISPEVEVFDPSSVAVVPNSAGDSFKQNILETHTVTFLKIKHIVKKAFVYLQGL